MSAIRTVFELVSHANVVDISGTVAPLFTIRIVAVDFDSIPYAGLPGAGMGDIHPAVHHLRPQRPHRRGGREKGSFGPRTGGG
ncbi:hypothetical protein [Amycolatopsis sp. NPDC051102]|uniref:hypothetical protein n=1 Tax=Amycolatopsis sp. NPDC051102 TaxID=3155163 RepID=UPI003416506A